MIRYLFDTNAVIALLKNASPSLSGRVGMAQRDDLGLSSVVMYELFFGAYRSRQIERNLRVLRTFQRDFVVVDFDTEDACEAGAIRADLARSGTPIGPYDLLIAGQAKARGLCLVTNNTREFSRVPGLRIEDWTTDR